jgi:hypothetical protein
VIALSVLFAVAAVLLAVQVVGARGLVVIILGVLGSLAFLVLTFLALIIHELRRGR